MIQATQVSKQFKGNKGAVVHALRDVSFSAPPGQITGLLGINGAGKTTMMRILATLIRPNSGEVQVDGLSVTSQADAVRRHIGFLSSTAALYARLTPREVLQYFGRLYDLDSRRLKERTDYVVETLQLQEFLDRPCEKLSTGQKQRTSIGRAILHDPSVLLLDEPTAGLDVVAAQTVLEFVEEARASGRTILYSTHIMSEVERLCDQVFIIHAGEIGGSGSVEALKESTGQPSLEKAFLAVVGYERELAI